MRTVKEKIKIFDSHFHIIDDRFPLVANQGYLPDNFTCADYLERARKLKIAGGAIVSGSFQAFDQTYLVTALEELGPTFVGVTQLPASVPDEEIMRLNGAGVRAVRFNLRRGGSEGVEVVSHRSAAALHGLGDLDADRAEFTVATRRQSRDRDVRFHLATLAAGEWTVLDGLPVTTVERTLVDLARGHLDGGHLAGVVRDAVTTLHLEPGVVARALAPFARRYGAAPEDAQGLVRQFLEEAGIPAATRAAARMVAPAARTRSQR